MQQARLSAADQTAAVLQNVIPQQKQNLQATERCYRLFATALVTLKAHSARRPQHLWALTSAGETEVPDFGAATKALGCVVETPDKLLQGRFDNGTALQMS